VAFEVHALILALHYEVRFLRSPGSLQRAVRAFESIVERQSAPASKPARKSAAKAAPKAPTA